MILFVISFVCPLCSADLLMEFDEDRIGVCDDIVPTDNVVFVYTSWLETSWIPAFTARVVVERGMDDPNYEGGLKPGCVWHYAEEIATSSSLFGAVHFETGEFGFGAPLGAEPKTATLNNESLLFDARGRIVGFEIEAQFLKIVVVRQEKGVWQGTIADGGSDDLDAIRNGWIQVSVRDLLPLDGFSEAPLNLDNKDIVIAIDTNQLIAHYTVIGN